jgi:pimeloyl-ACP methyl ester carboxylesterase
MNHARLSSSLRAAFLAGALLTGVPFATWASPAAAVHSPSVSTRDVTYGSMTIDGLNIAYREAGDPKAPKIVLLMGFPASGHQYRKLIDELSNRFHVIAPDYQGFGASDAPDPAGYAYTFDKLADTTKKLLAAKGFDHFGLYAQDYGGPVGFRIVTETPAKLDWLIIQNTNAYPEGFSAAWDGFRKKLWLDRSAENEKPLATFLTHDGIKGIYLAGAAHPDLISPDNWEYDSGIMARPGHVRLNLDLFYDYRKNAELYPVWEKFLHDHQPKTIIFWGQHDPFFTPEGGEAYLRDLPKAEMYRLNAGHFAAEDNAPFIADRMKAFYNKVVKAAK